MHPNQKSFELSITVGVGGEDIDMALMSNIKRFLKECCISGLCSLERGGALFHLHFQMVICISAKSIVTVNRLIKRYMGWDKDRPVAAVVMCQAFKQRNLHTYQGMLGYGTKDLANPNSRVLKNVSADYVQAGVDLYVRNGADKVINRVCLTSGNIFDRCFIYWKCKLGCRLCMDLPSCLLKMLRGGKYYPSASWIIPHQGRGMDYMRA